MNRNMLFQTSQEVRFGKVLLLVIPTYLTSLFNTLYAIVDGIFVASYVGTDALAAINIAYPIVNVLTGIALLFATGGSAIAALYIGAGKQREAERAFSVSILGALVIGCLIAGGILLFLTPILQMLGATMVTLENSRIYSMFWLVAAPAVLGKELLTYFIRVDGSPSFSFFLALSCGGLNIVLDYVFVGKLHMGIYGAALATVLGIVLSCVVGICYFVRKRLRARSRKACQHSGLGVNKGYGLRFTMQGLSLRLGVRCMVNGVSEFVNQLAIAIMTVVFNLTAMQFAGKDGIAAVSIIMYLQFIFIGVYFGYSMGIAPQLGYAHGDGRHAVCKKLESCSIVFLSIAQVVIYVLTFFGAPFGVALFAQGGSAVCEMAVRGMRVYGLGFLFAGLNIFAAVRMMSYGKGH
ncbi:MAG: MATE family efflux transporter [Lachnospiraceae bacterium]|nr:MATE family efflux transporter [bacterium]MDY5517927.1 MATE family efflux transporter [Lachnospiraceae bacterium]